MDSLIRSRDLGKALAALPTLSTSELRELWQDLLEHEPPAHVSRKLMIRVVAYQLQVRRHGGLSDRTHKTLLSIASGDMAPREAAPSQGPPPGTRLARVWNGRTYVVDVTETGVTWEGRPYRSLSAVARAITGTRWNGRLFFGLTP